MSDSKVKVTANKDGHVIVVSGNNPDYGHIRVEQIRMVVDDTTGFAKLKPISALIPGLVKDLKGFGFSDQQEIDGKIRIVEKTIPFNKKDPDRDLKVAGKSGIVCSVGDKPIYRKHFYTPNTSLEDATLAHDNQEEIKATYAEVNAESNGLPQSDEFNL